MTLQTSCGTERDNYNDNISDNDDNDDDVDDKITIMLAVVQISAAPIQPSFVIYAIQIYH